MLCAVEKHSGPAAPAANRRRRRCGMRFANVHGFDAPRKRALSTARTLATNGSAPSGRSPCTHLMFLLLMMPPQPAPPWFPGVAVFGLFVAVSLAGVLRFLPLLSSSHSRKRSITRVMFLASSARSWLPSASSSDTSMKDAPFCTARMPEPQPRQDRTQGAQHP